MAGDDCCNERRKKFKSMTHVERMVEYKRLKRTGYAMLYGGIGCFGGMFAAMNSSMGTGAAFAVAIGSSSGFIFGSMGPFGVAKDVLVIDEEMAEAEKGTISDSV